MNITARSDEVKILDQVFKSKKAEFLAVYGRRHVGKTYLVTNYFNNKKCIFITITGIENGSYLRFLAANSAARNDSSRRESTLFRQDSRDFEQAPRYNPLNLATNNCFYYEKSPSFSTNIA